MESSSKFQTVNECFMFVDEYWRAVATLNSFRVWERHISCVKGVLFGCKSLPNIFLLVFCKIIRKGLFRFYDIATKLRIERLLTNQLFTGYDQTHYMSFFYFFIFYFFEAPNHLLTFSTWNDLIGFFYEKLNFIFRDSCVACVLPTSIKNFYIPWFI